MNKYVIFILFLVISCNSSKSLRNKHYGNSNRTANDKTTINPSLNTVTPKVSYNSFIQSWLGVPYKWGGMTKSGTDCSGFTLQYYKNVYNIVLNRTTTNQYNQGKFINKSDLKRGDLVFFKGTTNKPGITHVGVYLENGQFVHASTSQGVTISDINDSYYSKHYAGARRIIL